MLKKAPLQAPLWSVSFALLAILTAYGAVPALTLGLLSCLQSPLSMAERLLWGQFATGLAWVIILFFLIRRYPGALGLRFTGSVVLYSVIASLGGLLIGAGLTAVLARFGVPLPELGQTLPAMDRTALVVFTMLIAPVVEEIAFRGLLQPALAQRMNPWLAVFLTALLFAALHWPYARWPGVQGYVFVLGLWFGLMRQWSGSLVPPIAGHFLNNAIVLLSL